MHSVCEIMHGRRCGEEDHDFRKSIAMAWINLDLYWSEGKDGPMM